MADYTELQSSPGPYSALQTGGYSYVPGPDPTPVWSDASKLPRQESDDALFGFALAEQFEFYKRLAAVTAAQDKDSLAAQLLEHWIAGTGELKVIANERIKNHRVVLAQLADHREVFLSKKKTNFSTNNRIGGVVPRLQDGRWDGTSDLSLEYQPKGVELVTSFQAYLLKRKLDKNQITPQERIELDLFMSLHTTSIETKVIVNGTKPEQKKVVVHFVAWESRILDNYNWTPEHGRPKHMTVPNPDYNNGFGVARPVSPNESEVRIYHIHALELESKGLGKRFDFTSVVWQPDDKAMMADETVTL